MDEIDAMEPSRRAIVNEYGYAMVRQFLAMFGQLDDHTLRGLCERERQKRAP